MRLTPLFAALTLALLSACGAPNERTSTISLDLGSDTSALEGLSVSPRGTLWVLSQDALHELDREGNGIQTLDLALLQPEGDRYRDVLDLGDGTFAASHTLAVARVYPDEGYSEDYFCLEPGFFEPMPVEPSEPEPGPITRFNPSLSADLDRSTIYATPRVMENGELIDNKIVEYTLEGEFLRALPLEGYRPQAIAVRDNLAILLEDGQLARLDISGRAPVTLEVVELDLDNAVGAALDGDELLILDNGAREIATFAN